MLELLFREDIQELFGCGRNKALKILHTVGARYVGRRPYITAEQLLDYSHKHDTIKLDWRY